MKLKKKKRKQKKKEKILQQILRTKNNLPKIKFLDFKQTVSRRKRFVVPPQLTSRRAGPNREYKMPTFDDYAKLINSVSWKWHLKTGWEYEELKAEGSLIFVKVSNDHIPERSKFSTTLVTYLNQHFQNMLNTSRTQKRRHIACELDETFFKTKTDPENDISFFDLLKDLPDDSKEVIQAVFETPAEILDVLEIKKVSKSALFKYFTDIRGWGQSRTNMAFQEIKDIL